MSVSPSKNLLLSVINHIVLPPQVPTQEDHNESVNRNLAKRLVQAAELLRDHTEGADFEAWEHLAWGLRASQMLNAEAHLDKDLLRGRFKELSDDMFLVLHVASQNAGILIYHDTCDESQPEEVFEVFEASPTCTAVLNSQNALLWDFPGSVIALPQAKFSADSFIESLSTFIEHASSESISKFASFAKKAGTKTPEFRDTANPALITQYLVSFLSVLGRCVEHTPFRKRIRDEVSWAEKSELPWRRSPLWLVLRVGVQSRLRKLHGDAAGRLSYKLLVAAVVAQTLQDATGVVNPAIVELLKAKLAKRLAKIEILRQMLPPDSEDTKKLADLNAALQEFFTKTLVQATNYIELQWTDFKRQCIRPVPRLPPQVGNSDLKLSLPSSGDYLKKVMVWNANLQTKSSKHLSATVPKGYNPYSTNTNQIGLFTHPCFNLASIEEKFDNDYSNWPPFVGAKQIAGDIETYLSLVGSVYDHDPRQKSVMILQLMRMWCQLDQLTVTDFPLLKDFHTCFVSETFDVLQLSSLEDLQVLQSIQGHLRSRYDSCKPDKPTIFDDPSPGCFAVRYVNQLGPSSPFQTLLTELSNAAEHQRASKQQQWRDLTAQAKIYDSQINQEVCLRTTITDEGEHSRSCQRCLLQRKRGRMRVGTNEYPLPAIGSHRTALIFELKTPSGFALYRDITWKILHLLESDEQRNNKGPGLLLTSSALLRPYVERSNRITLASSTKPFEKTHYRKLKLPIPWSEVCKPCGLTLRYYDTEGDFYTASRRLTPTITHHLIIPAPLRVVVSSMQSSDLETEAATAKVSSYSVIANQYHCPPGLNVHECLAIQEALTANDETRWLKVLIELGSSNINFSTEPGRIMIDILCSRAGRIHEVDILRVAHTVFRDPSFCNKLCTVIEDKHATIVSNWREVHCMDTLITLALQALSYTAGDHTHSRFRQVLQSLRDSSYRWLTLLLKESFASTDIDSARQLSFYIFQVAMLFRKTFKYLTESFEVQTSTGLINVEDLARWIEVSIHLRNNMPARPIELQVIQRNELIRDSKLVRRLLRTLEKSVQVQPEAFAIAINRIIFADETYHIHGTYIVPNSWWIHAITNATNGMRQQAYHYHLVEGHLLADGSPIGQLHAEHRDSSILHDLFGNRNILTWPSRLHGMTHLIAFPIFGHQVHLGFRDNRLFVRVLYKGNLLEYIPRQQFIGSKEEYDIPAPLVDDCFHWLNIVTGQMEIRGPQDAWKSKLNSWRVDVRNHKITREINRKTSTLVDPLSHTFRTIAKLFQFFEHDKQLLVSQSSSSTGALQLRVELRRLDLKFFVNKNGLLESRQLRAEFDPNQDAGTWYGLRSMIVLRNITNPLRRIILTPLGTLTCYRQDFHVVVYVQNSGEYGRYTINEVLNRVECPQEPLLIYSKAMFHAFTSFVVADPLTGRTGGEEACHLLCSGISSPWTPLSDGPLAILTKIASLVPLRKYYPRGMKFMERVTWNENATFTLQHDSYLSIVQTIVDKARLLQNFSASTAKIPSLPSTELHLSLRALQRRGRSERTRANEKLQHLLDSSYSSRHVYSQTVANMHVSEIANLLEWQPPTLFGYSSIIKYVRKWRAVKGFSIPYKSFFLTDLLNIEFDREWGSLVRLCIQVNKANGFYDVIFILTLLAFQDDPPMDLIRALVAFTIYDDFKVLEFPETAAFIDYRYKVAPSVEGLSPLLKAYALPFKLPNSMQYGGLISSKKLRKRNEAEKRNHDRDVLNECKIIIERLLVQWPCGELIVDTNLKSELINISKATKNIRSEWYRLHQNWLLSAAIDNTQELLQLRAGGTQRVAMLPNRSSCQAYYSFRPVKYWQSTLPDLLSSAGSSDFRVLDLSNHLHRMDISEQEDNFLNMQKSPLSNNNRQNGTSKNLTELENIVHRISQSLSNIKRTYADDLMKSIQAFRDRPEKCEAAPKLAFKNFGAVLRLVQAQECVSFMHQQIEQILDPGTDHFKWLKLGGLWPVTTPVALLEQLRSTSTFRYEESVRQALTAYGVAISEVQRLARMHNFIRQNDIRRFEEDLKNLGHKSWNPMEHPDWLLFEIDANVALRENQTNVAVATIWPSSGKNSVLQMNMGEGKTSCIMPICAATLANSQQLARVIVPKALLQQTAQLLQARLGGLLGRSLTHIPWSRKTPTNATTIDAYKHLHFEAKKNSGLLLSLPEHLLSFQLSGQQRLSDGFIGEANTMLAFQNWLQIQCRDMLDESDHTLAVRTQLIYPSGSQVTVDGHPHRWEASEQLLKLVASHLEALFHRFPRSILASRTGGFWTMHFLRSDVENALIELLTQDILQDRIHLLQTLNFSDEDRKTIREYISSPVIERAVTERALNLYSINPVAVQLLHLCRGLLANRIILLTLKKRWNVQYGLHPGRDPLAVPYHAKGVPSDEAEWGHPDVAILFTCLSFYYGGLRIHELRQSLEHVGKADDPAGEFERWQSRSSTLPSSLRNWSAISVDDAPQLTELWTHVRYETAIIDYYLNRFVFPKFATQFTVKLQSSGWDLPLYSYVAATSTEQGNSSATKQQALTTGFSGTNDNRSMLPLTIQQHDLPALAHTNAEVLTYLLQKRNRRAIVASNKDGSRLSECDILKLVWNNSIRVLIDAGAMILEMDNATVARAWLEVDWEAPAAIYFGENDKPMVISRTRRDKPLPLVATPYAEDLGNALIYLDQSHTRGTDLNIPANAVGALTLGLGQSKDATVQAAMRLRQLGTTQSVVFLAPPQVHQSMLDLQKRPASHPITSYDVICWLLEQTCIGLEQLQPLYYSQGVDFSRRRQAEIDYPDHLHEADQRATYLTKIQHKEYLTLDSMYKPKPQGKAIVRADTFAPSLRSFVVRLGKIHKEMGDAGPLAHASALEEVEQEREVAFEVESVREVQKPERFKALLFPGLHPEIKQFLETGQTVTTLEAYQPAFTVLSKTQLGRTKGVRARFMKDRLFASRELSRTIAVASKKPNDDFIRPVNYILFSTESNAAIIINPEEAAATRPILERLQRPSTHLLLYSAPTTRKMYEFTDLTFYALPTMPAQWRAPEWLRLGLCVFAGGLYFDYEDYTALKNILNAGDALNGTQHGAHYNGIGATKVPRPTSLTARFLQEWLSIRRKGQDFTHTPMGQVCQGRILAADDPFFTRPNGALCDIPNEAVMEPVEVNESTNPRSSL